MDILESRTSLSVTIVVCSAVEPTPQNLVVTGDAAADLIEIHPQGDDLVVVANGIQTSYTGIKSVAVYSGDGDDTVTLRGDEIGYFVDGGADNDAIFGSAGNDWLQDESGDDLLIGGAGDDYLAGGPGADVLKGGPGDDALLGETGADQLIGGTGKDHTIRDAFDVISSVEELF